MKALIIFAKEPVPGEVKTRLTPFLSPEAAAGLYHSMVLDTLAKAEALEGVAVFLYYIGGEKAVDYFREVAARAVIRSQSGRDLGERMRMAFAEVFAGGYKRAVIVGTDSPDLPSAYLDDAFLRLEDEHVDAVFGSSDDGGYYLLGLKVLYPELFEGVAWSSPTVMATSLAKAEKLGIRTALLPLWHDLDIPVDLFRAELTMPSTEARLTRKFLVENLPATSIPPADILVRPGKLPSP